MTSQRLNELLGRHSWLPWVILSLVALLYRADILFSSRTYYNNDIYQEFCHYKIYLKEAVANRRLPLWCPEQFSGMPFCPNPQAGVFYPTTLLFLLLPFPRALAVHYLIHNLLAGGFMWGYLRRLNIGYEGSLLGAMLAMASGFQAWEVIHPQTLAAAVWPIPTLFFLEGSLSRRSLADAWAAGSCMAMSFLAGNPQMFLGTFYLGIFYCLYRLPWRRIPMAHRGLWWISLGLGLGVAMAMALPFLEMARLGGRKGGMSYAEAASYSLHLKSVFHMVCPFFKVPLGMPLHLVHQHALEWTDGRTLVFIGYMGTLALLLSLQGASQRATQPWWFFSVSAVLVLWIAMGTNAPFLNLHRLFYFILPGINFLRTPFRYLFLYNICVAILAALGLQSLKERRAGKLIPLLFIAFLSCVILWDCSSRDAPGRALWLLHAVPLATGLLGSILLLLPWKPCFLLLLLALVPVELFWHKNRAWPIGPDDLFDFREAQPLLQFLRSHNDEGRVFLDRMIVLPGGPLERCIPSKAMDPFMDPYLSFPTNASMIFGLKNASGYNPLMMADYTDLLSIGHKARQWLRVRWFLTPQPDVEGMPRVWSQGNAHVYDMGPILPRLWICRKVRSFPDDAYLFQHMLDPLFDPQREVLFREMEGITPIPRTILSEPDLFEILEDEAESILVRVQLASPAYLVFPDPYCPGWRAYLNRDRIPILKANLAFRAVYCPAGDHEIRLVYRPWSLILGVLCSCACLCSGLALSFIQPQWRERCVF